MSPPLRVTAAVLVRAGRLLLAQRNSPAYLAGKWELPGGKIEPGEEPEQCLERELREELGVDTRVGRFLGSHTHDYGELCVELLAYAVELVAGEPSAKEHSALSWVPRADLVDYELAPADVPLMALVPW